MNVYVIRNGNGEIDEYEDAVVIAESEAQAIQILLDDSYLPELWGDNLKVELVSTDEPSIVLMHFNEE